MKKLFPVVFLVPRTIFSIINEHNTHDFVIWIDKRIHPRRLVSERIPTTNLRFVIRNVHLINIYGWRDVSLRILK